MPFVEAAVQVLVLDGRERLVDHGGPDPVEPSSLVGLARR